MATAVVNSFLSDNDNSTPFDEIALKVWAGILLGSYNMQTVTEGRHIMRTITNGKSAQFPVFGPGTTNWHTRGEEITFEEMGASERVISIDGLLLAPYFIDVLDEAKAHFDIRREIAIQQGQQLAEQADQRVLMSYIAASQAAANITYPVGQETPAGSTDRIVNAAIGTDAAVLKGAIYDAAEDLDEHNVPSSDRYAFLAPAQFYLLLQDGEFIDRDFNDAGNGGRAGAVMRNAADFEIVKTNNLPRTDLSAASATLEDDLEIDYTTNIAVVGHKSAAGSVTLIGLGFEGEWDPNRQGHMMIAKYAKGFNYLRPEAAVEFATA